MSDSKPNKESVVQADCPLECEDEAVMQAPAALLTQRAHRALAVHLLYTLDRSDYELSIEHVVESVRKGYELEIKDDAFALTLVRGVVAHRKELDQMIEPLLESWSFERLGCCTVIILRMALWELVYAKSPVQVVINESVELAKAFSEEDAYKFVNGLLDRFCKLQGIETVALESSSD
jgi:N utilization substance protein B